jgi:hypothetical protein
LSVAALPTLPIHLPHREIRTSLLAEIGMMEVSRGEEAQYEFVAMITVEEKDAAQFTLIREYIRANVQVVPTSSLTCAAIVESLIHAALIVNQLLHGTHSI